MKNLLRKYTVSLPKTMRTKRIKWSAAGSIVGTAAVALGVTLPIVLLKNNATDSRYSVDPATWIGYKSGNLNIVLDQDNHTATITNLQVQFNAANLVIPAVVYDDKGNAYDIIIGESAFSGSMIAELTGSITFESGIKSIGVNAFTNTNLISINLGTVELIHNSAFGSCSNLHSINSENLKSVGVAAFTNCENLTSIDLENVDSINDYAFYQNYNLQSISVGENLKSIGISAFFQCYNLNSMIAKSWNLNSIDSNAFEDAAQQSGGGIVKGENSATFLQAAIDQGLNGEWESE